MYLSTDRLLLRPVEYMDIDQLVAIWADPEVTLFIGGPLDPGQVRDLLDEEVENPPKGAFGHWPLVEKHSGRVAGDCGLIEKQIDGAREIEIVYTLARWAWDKGYATEIGEALLDFAFVTLELPRVVSLIQPNNERSKRVAGKLGMCPEKRVLRRGEMERELWVRSKS